MLSYLAVAGGGVFSTAAALAAGVHPTVLRAAVRSGRLVCLRRGWYALAAPRRPPEAWHALRIRAELASRAADLVATHDSALVLHGLPTCRERLTTVHLGRINPQSDTHTDPEVATTRRRLFAGHRCSGEGATACVVHRVPAGARAQDRCVEPAFATVQLGLYAGPREALVVADAALARRLASRDDLDGAVRAYRHTPGIAAVRAVIQHADPRAESPGESRLRHVVICLGYRVEVQVEVPVTGIRYRADLRIVGTRLLLEYDGLGKYDDPEELRRERTREALLRADGWDMVRFGHQDVDQPAQVLQRIEAVLSRGWSAGSTYPPARPSS